MRYFNTEGVCRPDVHYMVRLDDRLDKIKRLYVDRGKYFVINRGRQYGKTTTLKALAEYLKEDYVVIAMDFQMMSTANLANERAFACKFIGQVENFFSRKRELLEALDTDALHDFASLKMDENISIDVMFEGLSKICETSKKPVVLMIDEVDSASNNQVFIDFLAQLRGYYLDRENQPTFHSVILAGVYDIKNLKLKPRPDEEHQYNSPWNIAANFDMDMSFSAGQIEDMLKEYEADHHTGMETEAVAEEIYRYTSGYPYLVSAICKVLDETLPEKGVLLAGSSIWSKEGVINSVKCILKDNIPLFGSMIRHISEYPDMKKMLYAILFQGEQVANRIFETRLYDCFLSEEELTSAICSMAKQSKSQFVLDRRLNMDLVLEKFVEYFHDIYKLQFQQEKGNRHEGDNTW